MFNFNDSKILDQNMLILNQNKDKEINVVFIYFNKDSDYNVIILEDRNEAIEDRFIPCHYQSFSDGNFIMGEICLSQGYLGYSTLQEAYEFINDNIL